MIIGIGKCFLYVSVKGLLGSCLGFTFNSPL